MKKMLFLILLLIVTPGWAASYDKEIILLEQSRNDKVTEVFKAMMAAYREEDLTGFFQHVSEDRFVQDYMTFHEAIREDIRTYDIISFDSWINKITADGVKRYFYVRWEKRYESTQSNQQITQLGYSRFLFDEINGEYKLVELAGNNLWGGSLAEWRAEVPPISGQEQASVAATPLPDLVIRNLACPAGSGPGKPVIFEIVNIGTANAIGPIEYQPSGTWPVSSYAPSLTSNATSGPIKVDTGCTAGDHAVVDPNNRIVESDETNNNQAY